MIDRLAELARRIQLDSAPTDGSGGILRHPDGYVVILDRFGVPSVYINAADFDAIRAEAGIDGD